MDAGGIPDRPRRASRCAQRMRNRPAQRLARARVRMHRVASDLVAQKVDCAAHRSLLPVGLVHRLQGLRRQDQLSDLIPFIVEVKNPGDCAKLAQQSAPGGRPLAHISASYASDPQTRFCTARVKLGDVARFLASEHVRRAKMGLPGIEMRRRPARRISWKGLSAGPVGATRLLSSRSSTMASRSCGAALLRCIGQRHRRCASLVLSRFWDQWAGLGESAHPIQRPWRAQPAYGYGRETRHGRHCRVVAWRSGRVRHLPLAPGLPAGARACGPWHARARHRRR